MSKSFTAIISIIFALNSSVPFIVSGIILLSFNISTAFLILLYFGVRKIDLLVAFSLLLRI